jgi:hypothetical protein
VSSCIGFATSTSLVQKKINWVEVQRQNRLCGHAPNRHMTVRKSRSPLLQLHAQMDPKRKSEGIGTREVGGSINWDVIQKQFALFSKMALPYFKEEKSARVLLAIVIAFTLLNSGVSVGFSYLSRDFWSALNAKDTEAFYPTLGKYAIALTGGTPVAVLYTFYRNKLAVQWRSWMTQRILDMYEANRSYYALEMKGELDNPDQRIAEDARDFTSVSLGARFTCFTSTKVQILTPKLEKLEKLRDELLGLLALLVQKYKY